MLNSLRFSRRAPLVISLAAALLLIIAFVVWWNFVYQAPRNVFWAALSNNLQTSSVTKHVSATENGEGVDQYIRLQYGGTNAADWLVTLKQANSNVMTESIGTPNAGYVRYVKADTSQKHADGSSYDFGKVVNVWAKADGSSGDTLKQLFAQTVLDIGTVPTPPIANLPNERRQDIVQFMQDQGVYAPDYSTMKREKRNGREVYVYEVKVKLAPYLRMMQSFARALGLKDLEASDPSQFQSQPPLTMKMTVDATSRRLVELNYEDQKYKQEYSGYGITTPITVPDKTIPITELQKRLQNL